MDRQVKIWQLIPIILSFTIAVLTLGFTSGTKFSALETKVNKQDIEISEIKKDIREDKQELNKKLDGLDSKVDDIRVLLQDKQDRKR